MRTAAGSTITSTPVPPSLGQRVVTAWVAALWAPCLGCLMSFVPLDNSHFLPPIAVAAGLAGGAVVSLLVGGLYLLRKVPAAALLLCVAALLYGPLLAAAAMVSVNELADTAPPTEYRLRVDAIDRTVVKGGREIVALRCTAVAPSKREFVVGARELGSERLPAVGDQVPYQVYRGALGIEYVRAAQTNRGTAFGLTTLMAVVAAVAAFFAGGRKSSAMSQAQVVALAQRVGFVVEPEPNARPAIAKPWTYDYSLRARLPQHPQEERPGLYRGASLPPPYVGPNGYLVHQKTAGEYERFIVGCFLGERMRIDVALGQVQAQLFAVTKHAWPGSDMRSGDAAFDARYNIHMVSGDSMLAGPKMLEGTIPVPEPLRRAMLDLPPALDASLAYDGAWMTFALDAVPDEVSFRTMLTAFQALEAFVPTVLDVLHRVRRQS